VSGLNGPPILNGGSNNYDRSICFDAPVEFDTGLVGQRGRTLKEMRERLMRRLGFAAMVANPPPGMPELLNDFLTDSQEQLYYRYTCLRTERWFGWQMQTGKRFYDIPVDCTKALNLRKLRWVGLADNGGVAMRHWAPNTAMTAGIRVYPTTETGLEYEVTTAGTTGAVAPAWPTVIGQTVVDGTVTFTARKPISFTWNPLIQGIDPMLYTVDNYGIPTNFDVREYVEVYPAPDKPYVLQILGHIGLLRFTEDNDVATIDDSALFTFALAMAKAHYRHPDANNYAQMADRLIRGMVADSHGLKRNIQRVSTAGLKFPLNSYLDPPNWQQPVGTWRQ
jgi:hypothetical protein